MSRSASIHQLAAGLQGLSTSASAEFSFFLAIPVMLGMSALKLIQLGGFGSMSTVELISLGIGFAVSFLVALIVVKKFIAFLQKKSMTVFACYRIVFGLFVLILSLVRRGKHGCMRNSPYWKIQILAQPGPRAGRMRRGITIENKQGEKKPGYRHKKVPAKPCESRPCGTFPWKVFAHPLVMPPNGGISVAPVPMES